MDVKRAFETNKQTWNRKVSVHANSDFYRLEAFKKGACSLQFYEKEALGNVSGKSLLHLQCHFGQDTLSWARKGARCTGIDISDKAIEMAKALATELALQATFVCCNVMDVSRHVSNRFDIVFTSYGVVGWIPELNPWAEMIAERLEPGGYFYMVEFHPIPWMFNYLKNPPQLAYGYQQKDAIYERYEGTYADESAPIVSEEYSWNHGLAEVIGALLKAGLTLERFNEFEASPYNVFPNLVRHSNGMYARPDALFPLVYDIGMRKPT
ncbi:class I SAM-dependent methyltransferase [Altibacter sp. HG106]|uniref:class I SAM-dependent methyltransferase n=1 Tax=Altibacter sp. HG106 TaxID=3023937 RepID=UPI0023504B63|nr:class I SAM-dependent methyltransferase [Altibacter sp. HG106]MDC7995862.1 methyltransferase domain-containing protein [Altibacter sp. HG106]